jgi:hypothetical protein
MVKYTNQLTSEEISLALLYVDKWDEILFSTKPIDRQKAKNAIENAYKILKANGCSRGISTAKTLVPDVVFLSSSSPDNLLNLFADLELHKKEYFRLKAFLTKPNI